MSDRTDRWQKAAERETARRQRDAGPLFAALVQPADPAAVQTRAERLIREQAQAITDGHAASEAAGQVARATIAAHVSAEELAELDRRRAVYPTSGEYTADFWCGECRKRGLPWPGQKRHEVLWAEVARLEAEQAQREAARAAASGEQLDLPTGVRIALPRARVMLNVEQRALHLEHLARRDL